MNQLANTLDFTHYFDKALDHFENPIPINTFINTNAKYINPNDGLVYLIVKNGKLGAFGREREIESIDENERTITTKRDARLGDQYTFYISRKFTFIDQFRSTESFSKASGYVLKQNIAATLFREDVA